VVAVDCGVGVAGVLPRVIMLICHVAGRLRFMLIIKADRFTAIRVVFKTSASMCQ